MMENETTSRTDKNVPGWADGDQFLADRSAPHVPPEAVKRFTALARKAEQRRRAEFRRQCLYIVDSSSEEVYLVPEAAWKILVLMLEIESEGGGPLELFASRTFTVDADDFQQIHCCTNAHAFTHDLIDPDRMMRFQVRLPNLRLSMLSNTPETTTTEESK